MRKSIGIWVGGSGISKHISLNLYYATTQLGNRKKYSTDAASGTSILFSNTFKIHMFRKFQKKIMKCKKNEK
jgi:hypothetical protein